MIASIAGDVATPIKLSTETEMIGPVDEELWTPPVGERPKPIWATEAAI
jgi:hypothetical protein